MTYPHSEHAGMTFLRQLEADVRESGFDWALVAIEARREGRERWAILAWWASEGIEAGYRWMTDDNTAAIAASATALVLGGAFNGEPYVTATGEVPERGRAQARKRFDEIGAALIEAAAAGLGFREWQAEQRLLAAPAVGGMQ